MWKNSDPDKHLGYATLPTAVTTFLNSLLILLISPSTIRRQVREREGRWSQITTGNRLDEAFTWPLVNPKVGSMMTMKMRYQKVFFITAWFSPDLQDRPNFLFVYFYGGLESVGPSFAADFANFVLKFYQFRVPTTHKCTGYATSSKRSGQSQKQCSRS